LATVGKEPTLLDVMTIGHDYDLLPAVIVRDQVSPKGSARLDHNLDLQLLAPSR